MNSILKITLAAILLTSCGGDKLSEKKKELATLKNDLKSMQDHIKKLEAEIEKLDTSKKEDERLEVKTSALAPTNFKTYIEIQGRLDADENVALSTQMAGVITKIYVKTGEEVHKGQVLAETDASALYQQLSDMETNLELARQVFQKQENLWNQKIGTEIQYLQAKTTKESLEKKVNAMHEQLRMSKIISPINGTVDAVNIKIAQMVFPGMGAINVVNFSNLKVKADLAESYSARVKTGNEVLVLFPDSKDSFLGKIHYASRSINVLTRTFGVEVLITNNKNYHPNMVAKLKINDYVSAKPQIVVPIKFIQKGIDENYVLVEENGIAVKKNIRISKEYNGMAEISDGLAEGDKLITEGYDLVNPGDAVKVKK